MSALEKRAADPQMALAPIESEQLPGLIRLALERNVPVETLERLIALQAQVMERDAEMEMAQALAAFQTECPPIPRVKTADVTKQGVKQYSYNFAPYEVIAKIIQPYLTKHGLSYTHDAEVGDGVVKVICTLQHIAGAKRKATFTGPFDSSGGKNPLQAVGSARSYGKRYSLADVLGLSTEDDDDAARVWRNGKTSSGGDDFDPNAPISLEQAKEIERLLDEAGTKVERFLTWCKAESVAAIPVRKYQTCVDELRARAEARKERQG